MPRYRAMPHVDLACLGRYIQCPKNFVRAYISMLHFAHALFSSVLIQFKKEHSTRTLFYLSSCSFLNPSYIYSGTYLPKDQDVYGILYLMSVNIKFCSVLYYDHILYRFFNLFSLQQRIETERKIETKISCMQIRTQLAISLCDWIKGQTNVSQSKPSLARKDQ